MPHIELAEVLYGSATLHGLIVGSTADWRAAGMSRKQLENAIGSGELGKVRHGAYATHATCPCRNFRSRSLAKDHSLAARADFCWPQYRTIAEADGMLKYQTPADMTKHHRRDNLLDGLGWKIVHFDWAELRNAPEGIVARIRNKFAIPIRLSSTN